MNSMASKRKPLELSFSEVSERSPHTHRKDEKDNGSQIEEFFALLDRLKEEKKQIRKNSKDSAYNTEENIKNRSSAWKPSLSMEDFCDARISSTMKDTGYKLKDKKSPTNTDAQKKDTSSAKSFDLNVEASPEP